jgi:hypothetical protein
MGKVQKPNNPEDNKHSYDFNENLLLASSSLGLGFRKN